MFDWYIPCFDLIPIEPVKFKDLFPWYPPKKQIRTIKKWKRKKR